MECQMRLAVIALLMGSLCTPASAQKQGEPQREAQSGQQSRPVNDGKKAAASESISRAHFQDAVAKLFQAADTNHDGIVTLTEFQAAIAAQKDALIQSRFAAVDTNHDQRISYEEFSRWERSLERLRSADPDPSDNGIVAEQMRFQPGASGESQVLARLIEPLSATVIAAANINYDAGMSLDEFQAYEAKRWEAVDTNHDGVLSEDELERAGLAAINRPPRG